MWQGSFPVTLLYLIHSHDFKYYYTWMTHKLISPAQTSPLNSKMLTQLPSPSPLGFLHGISNLICLKHKLYRFQPSIKSSSRPHTQKHLSYLLYLLYFFPKYLWPSIILYIFVFCLLSIFPNKNISSVDTEIFVRFDHCIDHYLVLRVMTGK